jgi:hypothetical protein
MVNDDPRLALSRPALNYVLDARRPFALRTRVVLSAYRVWSSVYCPPLLVLVGVPVYPSRPPVEPWRHGGTVFIRRQSYDVLLYDTGTLVTDSVGTST